MKNKKSKKRGGGASGKSKAQSAGQAPNGEPFDGSEKRRKEKKRSRKDDPERKKTGSLDDSKAEAADQMPNVGPSDGVEKQRRKEKKRRKDAEHNRRKEGKRGEGQDVVAAEAVRRAMEDERFAATRRDPLFRRARRKEAKVSLDDRFAGMLSNPDFAPSAAPVDKRGRPRSLQDGRHGHAKELLVHYHLQGEDGRKHDEDDEEKVEELDSDDKEDSEEGSSSTDDDDDEDEDDDGQWSVGSDICEHLTAHHEDTPMIEKETHRLAVVNMDWDHIKADDIYMVMTSCLPKGGQVLSVSVYPSELGLKCMAIEAVHGPGAVIADSEYENDDNDNDSDDDNVDFDAKNNKLRAYELKKLKYYFAVVVCDSVVTANHLYANLDGTELLKSSNVLDIRFIPDEMEFKQQPRDTTIEAPTNYKSPNFETHALQYSKVKLSWDDEPEQRKILKRKFNSDQLDDLNDYLASSDEDDTSGGESDDDHIPNAKSENSLSENGGGVNGKTTVRKRLDREKLLALLASGDRSDEDKNNSDEDDDKNKDMEITFNTQLEELSKRILAKKNSTNADETVWDQVVRKSKEKKKARKKAKQSSDNDGGSDDVLDDDFFDEDDSDADRNPKKKKLHSEKTRRRGKEQALDGNNEREASRAELELLFADEQDSDVDDARVSNARAKKSKKGKGKVVEEKQQLVDAGDIAKDERFSALFTSPLFALDPTDPQYKRSAAVLAQQSRIRAANVEDGLPPYEEEPALNQTAYSQDRAGVSEAVRSLKRNLQMFKKGMRRR